MEYTVNFTWDSDVNVWIAASDDIPGLVLESGSFDALLERTRIAVPELLELNTSRIYHFSHIGKMVSTQYPPLNIYLTKLLFT